MSATTARGAPLPLPVGAPVSRPRAGAGGVLERARAVTRQKATTFSLACRLLPGGVRDDVYLLYLVLRTLDDLVDDRRPEAGVRVAAVEDWAAGRAAVPTPEVELLRDLGRRHELPRSVVGDFCRGMRLDLARARFATEEELDDYCYCVAGTVGVLMSAILGVRDPARALPAAAALGMAMQRTNILRDIDEDLAAGRVFLAQESIDRHGSLLPGRRAALVRDGIARADALYDTGLAGVGQLLRGRRAVAAAGSMYREILREIERRGGDAPGRAVVARHRRLRVAAAAAAHV